jgi:phage terminase Nu1 subunit (DNA packaging protein)
MAAIARDVGVHKSTVSRQARAAGLVGEDGLVDLDAYIRLRATGLDPALQTTGRQARPAEDMLDDLAGPNLAAERARKMAADAQLAELALARQRGEVIEAAAVARETEDLARRLRTRLLLIPREVAHDLALLGEEAAIRGHLTLKIESALTEELHALRGAGQPA